LPSTRSVSQELGIARGTVVLADDRLAAEDYISSRLKAGIFVNKRLPDASVSVENGRSFKLANVISPFMATATSFARARR